MIASWLPKVLTPEFTWTYQRPTRSLTTEIPPTPQLAHPFIRRFWGHVHFYLRRFSRYYCSWLGIHYDNQIIPLPFGLLIKWSDGTRLEEVLATKVCYAAGIPTPNIICYGDQPDYPHAPVSILMTRLPGCEIGQVYPSLTSAAKATAVTEVKKYLHLIRQWRSPWGEEIVCSINSGTIRSIRVPNNLVGPCDTGQEFHNYLLSPARNTFSSEAEYEERLTRARGLQLLQPPGVRFTHGDLKHHNILIDTEGHITGFLDWESAGWYPEFWEYTTAMRFVLEDFWWFSFLMEIGGDNYQEELDCERALTNLTKDSFSW